MTAPLRNLFRHYRDHHDMDRPLLQWLGIVGCIFFPGLYAVRWAMGADAGYDDLPLRLVAAALCLGVAVRRWWPQRLRPWFIGYSYVVVFYSLSFLLSYTMLRNHGGTPGVINMVVGSVLVVLLADWRNAIAMLVLGYAAAAGAHLLTDPYPVIPREFVFAAGGSLLLVIGGALSHQGQKRVEVSRMRRVYSGLAGSIAHEMRNPLAQVRHSLDRIAAGLVPASGGEVRLGPEQVRTLLAAVQEGQAAVARGLQSIDLTLQQVRPTATDPSRWLDVSALDCVQAAVAAYAFEDAAQRERVRVEAGGDFRFRGDPAWVELVLLNLLKNALYYLPLRPGMTVTLRVQAEPSPRIVVRDTGPGIAADLLPRLFQEFQTSGKADGTGLGLAFCRRTMQALGGDIHCRSAVGEFTEFTLSFPPASSSQSRAAPAASPAPAAALAGRTVLVVDDQPFNRAIARALAADLGLQVMEATHAEQALQLLERGNLPDAILMDVNMPGLDGISATQRLRALPGAAGQVPVLAVTANDSPALQAAAGAAGLQGVLSKPIDRAAFAGALGSVLGTTSARAVGAPAQAPLDGLLDAGRLDDFRRLGLLDELLPTWVRDMRRNLRRLEGSARAGDAGQVREALHSLVGLSGEAGARALHAAARNRYTQSSRGSLPEGTAWIAELRDLLGATEQALAEGHGIVLPATATIDTID